MRLSADGVRISSGVYAVRRPRVRVRRPRPRRGATTGSPIARWCVVDVAARRVRGSRSRTAGTPASARAPRCAISYWLDPGPVVADDVRARRVVGLGPVEPRLRVDAAGPAPAVHALDAADEHDVVLAGEDRGAEPVHEHLRAVAAGGGEDRRAGLDAEPPGEQRAGIGVAPREDLDDRDGVDAQQRRAGVGAARRARRRRAGRSARRGRSGRRRAACAWPTPTMTGVRGSIGMSGATLVVRRAPVGSRPRASARWGRPARRCRDRSTGTSTCGRPRRRRRRGTRAGRRRRGSRRRSRRMLRLDRGRGPRRRARTRPGRRRRRRRGARSGPGAAGRSASGAASHAWTRARMSSASDPSRGRPVL